MAETDTSKQAGKPQDPAAKGASDEAKSPMDVLRENAGLMLTVLVAVIAISLALVYRADQVEEFNRRAWYELGELKKESPEGTDGFAELTQKYKGSQAEPYIKLAWASRLYATGERGKVERALELYEDIFAKNPDNPVFSDLLPSTIERIQAELKSDRAHLREGPAPASPEEVDDAPPLEEPGHEGHGHGPGEGHEDEEPGHEGHGHGPGEGHEDEAPAEEPGHEGHGHGPGEGHEDEAPAEEPGHEGHGHGPGEGHEDEAPAEDAPADAEQPE